MATLGFIGLGLMGRHMAGHLINAGHTVHVHDLDTGAVQALAGAGAVAAGSGRKVAEAAEVVFLMVPDSADVEAALFGPDGVAEGLAAGKTVVDMSSISPTATQRFAARLAEAGVDMLDAPVSGGPAGAEGATLSIMCGGKAPVFERIRSYFEVMGRNINLVGDHGAGQIVKLMNQIIVGVTLGAVSEAMVLVAKAGVDPRKAREAITGGAADSLILQRQGLRMIERDFAPGFRVKHQMKDLGNALSFARDIGVSIPATAAVQQMYHGVLAEAGGDADHSALVTALERLAKHTVG